MTSTRRELYNKIEILEKKIISGNSLDQSDSLIYEGGYYYLLLPIHFTIFIISSFLLYKCRSDMWFMDIDWMENLYHEADPSAIAAKLFLALNVIIIFYSISACYTEWYYIYYTNKEMLDKLKNLNTSLSNPSSKENFLKSLELLKTLTMDGTLTEFEVAKLIELLDNLII